jgi:flagellar M-ring protein FliF
MAQLIPTSGSTALAPALPAPGGGARGSILSPLGTSGGGSAMDRVRAFTAQPAVRRSLPAIAGVGALASAALLWFAMSQPPQRVLYGSLTDGERAEVVAALDKAGIAYTIDNAGGMLTVGEDDLYRARMTVASDGALAAPESTAEMLDAIPLGASRTLEGERLRNVRERELMMTIMEIDGVEAVRVHLATPERSVFVREQAAPTASVMVRLARGRSLNDDQVVAIGNLVAASVPGMSADAVRIMDQHGKLLSQRPGDPAGEGLELQRQFEEKLRGQVSQLLIPIVGEGNFSSEVQVELDRSETTSAHESYDKDGALRSESQSQSQQTGPGAAGGVPGVLANTPPPPTQIEQAAPQGTQVAPDGGPVNGESSARRTYELGRQVSVASTTPGGVRRLSVAVALSAEALKSIKPASVQQIERLVAAAVGANPERGDNVAVIASTFEAIEADVPPFYETGWFATILRHSVALLAVILALVFGVRPLVRALKRERPEEDEEESAQAAPTDLNGERTLLPAADLANAERANASLREQIELARKLAAERPEHAAETLRRMLAAPAKEAA